MRLMRASGFGLIELVITIAILAILLAIGLPSFESTMRSNRVATATNELMASLALARSEAIRNPSGAAICTSANGHDCGGDWNDGWIVWIDVDADGIPDAGGDERIIRHVQGRGRLAIANATSGVDDENLVRFDGRGRALGTTPREFRIEPDECPEGLDLVRILSLSAVGQVRVERDECGD